MHVLPLSGGKPLMRFVGPFTSQIGTKGQRYALPHATIHMHQPLGGAEGQASDIEIQAREILRLKQHLTEFLAEATGQSLDIIERDTDRNFFLDAEQAVKYGLVDKVLHPPKK